MQHGWFGEEPDPLVVPVGEYLTRCNGDVGSTTLKEWKSVWVLKERKYGEEMGLALRRRPVLNTSIVRNTSIEENVGRS
jgi:hypothetical protein